jgi:hypothetical protein
VSAGSTVAPTAPVDPGRLAGRGALATLAIAAALAGTILAVRALAARSPRLRVASLAAAVLLVATTAQAAPHIVHHVFDEDGGAACKVKRQADLVVGLTVVLALPAPTVAAVPCPVLREPDPPSAFRPAERSRAPPTA